VGRKREAVRNRGPAHVGQEGDGRERNAVDHQHSLPVRERRGEETGSQFGTDRATHGLRIDTTAGRARKTRRKSSTNSTYHRTTQKAGVAVAPAMPRTMQSGQPHREGDRWSPAGDPIRSNGPQHLAATAPPGTACLPYDATFGRASQDAVRCLLPRPQ